MADLADVGKALFGDEDSAVVKSGTLAVTRLTGWVGAVGLVLTNTEVFGKDLTISQKLWGSIAIVGIFAFIAAADALARGYATAHTHPELRTLPTPLRVKVPAKTKENEEGWKAVLIRFNPSTPDDLEFWLVRGDEAFWAKSGEIKPG